MNDHSHDSFLWVYNQRMAQVIFLGLQEDLRACLNYNGYTLCQGLNTKPLKFQGINSEKWNETLESDLC